MDRAAGIGTDEPIAVPVLHKVHNGLAGVLLSIGGLQKILKIPVNIHRTSAYF